MIRVTAGFVVMLAVLWGTPVVAIPPLSDEQHARLETARDGFDHREEAFFALVENLAAWDGALDDTPVCAEPDIDAFLDDPAAHRGAVCRLTGRLEQHHGFAPPYDVAVEWFIRNTSGRPLLVYVAGLDSDVVAAREGDQVELWGRFYKSVRFIARDGVERTYAAFVTAHPRLLGRGAAQAGGERFWMMAGPVAVLLIVFAAILIYMRRQHRIDSRTAATMRHDLHDLAARLDEAGPLPDDPAEALAELRRRAAALSDPSSNTPPDADAVRSIR